MITILVIDDNAEVRLGVRRVLERAGCAVIAVADRRSALRRLASLKADLVICDIGEERNGGPTLRDIGHIDPEMRMLVLSRKDRAHPARGGWSNTLDKPFTASELLAAIRRCLARPRTELD